MQSVHSCLGSRGLVLTWFRLDGNPSEFRRGREDRIEKLYLLVFSILFPSCSHVKIVRGSSHHQSRTTTAQPSMRSHLTIARHSHLCLVRHGAHGGSTRRGKSATQMHTKTTSRQPFHHRTPLNPFAPHSSLPLAAPLSSTRGARCWHRQWPEWWHSRGKSAGCTSVQLH